MNVDLDLFVKYHPCTPSSSDSSFFFFNDTATTEIYTLSLHDALPISRRSTAHTCHPLSRLTTVRARGDRKSTRLNSSHVAISYAVFCLKKKNNHLRACSTNPNNNNKLNYPHRH